MKSLIRKRKAFQRAFRYILGVTLSAVIVAQFALPTIHSAVNDANNPMDTTAKLLLGFSEIGLAAWVLILSFGG